MGFKDEMKEYDEQFVEDRETPRQGMATLPDGRHQVQITEARLEHDTMDDTYTIIFRFQNQEGSIRKWYNLDHEVGRSIFAQDAKMLDYEGLLSEVEEWLESEAIIGMVCEIGIRTKPGTQRDFKDVYLNRVLGKAELWDFSSGSAPAAEFAGSAADDDIPF